MMIFRELADKIEAQKPLPDNSWEMEMQRKSKINQGIYSSLDIVFRHIKSRMDAMVVELRNRHFDPDFQVTDHRSRIDQIGCEREYRIFSLHIDSQYAHDRNAGNANPLPFLLSIDVVFDENGPEIRVNFGVKLIRKILNKNYNAFKEFEGSIKDNEIITGSPRGMISEFDILIQDLFSKIYKAKPEWR